MAFLKNTSSRQSQAKMHRKRVVKRQQVVVGRHPIKRRRRTQATKVLSYDADQKAKRLARALGKARKHRKEAGENEEQPQGLIQLAPARRFKRGRISLKQYS